ncbi:MAG: hypothetical protein Q4C45_04470 [Oscillospiraceae bacterium]|nr:hypothetical protein [Oscillospiraceae bacterium]
MSDPSNSPQREAIRAWERRRRLQPVLAAAGLLLLLAGFALRRTAAGKLLLILGVFLIGAARVFLRINNRCPVCGCLNIRDALASRREFSCKSCGFTHSGL